jgi:hypothetical protein
MADNFTTNLNLVKPEVGSSTDTWGAKLNSNADTIDGLFPSGALPVNKGGTGSTTAPGARTNLGLGVFATATEILESQIADGTVYPRLGANETVTGNWTFSGTYTFSGPATFSGATTVPAATVTAHQASLSIAETQIPDGSLLARVGGNESITGTWSFSTVPTKAAAGKFVHYASATNNSGAITLSTAAPSGTPGAGDIWIRHAS